MLNKKKINYISKGDHLVGNCENKIIKFISEFEKMVDQYYINKWKKSFLKIRADIENNNIEMHI